MSATITERLKLILHDGLEFFNVKHFNDNLQKIDDNVLIKDDIVQNLETPSNDKVVSAAVSKQMQEEIEHISNVKHKDISIQTGTTTFECPLSDLGLTEKNLFLACQCANSTSAVCKIIGFNVVNSKLYISIEDGVQVETAKVRILYI